ncbi:MAG TPA: LuxR family transcriptional regulator [Acidimicrobiales bacterium]|nr:LuxR family transcriptional regulator [Acidimicrobiales bacterium]
MDGFEIDGHDAVAVLDVIESISGASGVHEYVTSALTGIAELISCIDVSYNEMVPSEGRVRWEVSPDPGGRRHEFAPVFSRLMRQNPLVRYFEETGDTRVMMWSDLASPEELARTALYQEMFRPLGVESQMAVTLPTPPGVVVGFAVNGDARGFNERDRAVLNRLRPHLAHAYQAAFLREGLSSADSAAGDPGWVGVLAGGDGIVEAATDNSETLEAVTGISFRCGDPLPGEVRESFVAGVASYDPAEPAVLSRPRRISDEADGVAAWHVPGPNGPHSVFIHSRVDQAARRLADVGLTRRQAEVALELCRGGTNAAIARRLGVAEGTLRKHLETIYRVLDVSDRASAIVRIRGF